MKALPPAKRSRSTANSPACAITPPSSNCSPNNTIRACSAPRWRRASSPVPSEPSIHVGWLSRRLGRSDETPSFARNIRRPCTHYSRRRPGSRFRPARRPEFEPELRPGKWRRLRPARRPRWWYGRRNGHDGPRPHRHRHRGCCRSLHHQDRDGRHVHRSFQRQYAHHQAAGRHARSRRR